MIISKTPVRVSFFGGGSDFPEHFERHGGAVLSTTIDKICYLAVGPLRNLFCYKIKVSYSRTELVDRVSEIEHPAVRACLEHVGITSGIEINYFSDLPARTGLGTSSSFVVGLLNALYAYQGQRLAPAELAKHAIHVERVRIGESVGWQDQYAVALGGLNYMEFRDDRVRIEPVSPAPETLAALEARLQLFCTGTQRYSDTIQKRHVAQIEKNAAVIRKLADMAAAGRDILGGGPDGLDAFGRLLDDAWTLKRGLGTDVSCAEVDRMYEAARAAGATGGKLLGAGGGGFLLLYVEPNWQQAVRNALEPFQEMPFRFAGAASDIILDDPRST